MQTYAMLLSIRLVSYAWFAILEGMGNSGARNGYNFHIFNEMPTLHDSIKEGGTTEMWLRALALASECQSSDFSSSSY